MKKIVVVLLMIQSVCFFGQGSGEDAPKPVKFNSSNISGILYYEAEEVAEKIKVKDEDLFYDVAKELRKYNAKVKETAFLNSKNFKKIDIMVNDLSNKDKSVPVDPEVKKKQIKDSKELSTVIPAVRGKIREFEIVLFKKFKSILSEKQYKKWLKYSKAQKRSLLPEKPKEKNNFESPNFGNQQRGRGQGGQLGGFR